MEKNNTINKPIYKYKPISYYSNSKKNAKNFEENEEEEEFSYFMDENKINKLKEEQVKKGKNINNINNITKSVEKDIKQNKNKEIISNINMNNNISKINNDINSDKEIKLKENKIKSKSVLSLNILNNSEFGIYQNNDENIKKIINDLKDVNKNKNETEKKSKKKIKKIKIKKKKNSDKINNISLDNNINKKTDLNSNSKEKEIDFKKNLKSIIKIQSKWQCYKSKKKLKLYKFIEIINNYTKKRKINFFNYFISNLKNIKKEKSNYISVDSEKYNELLKKEKNYEILNIKYEEVLKELNEIKNKIIFKQNLNMVNNKNQNISINIFPTKETKKNNFIIDNKNEIIILNKKEKEKEKQNSKIYNIFYLLKNKYDFLKKYYFKKFLLILNIQKNIEKNKNINNNIFTINKTKSFSLIKKAHNYIHKFCNILISNQISNFNIPKCSKNKKNILFQNLTIQKQCLLKLGNKKENKLYISDKNEINIKKDKNITKIKNKKENYIINRIKSFIINKDEINIQENIFNYIKNNKNILKKIKEIFDIKYFNENEFCINRINEIKYKKIKDKKNNIICKSSSNNFSLNKIHKSPINYIITKIQKNFKIKASKVKANDFIITKNINNFKIKGIDYSEVTIDVILYISDTYELTINSTKKKETQKSYQIIKVINNYMIDIKKEQYKKNDYMFDNNKLIINKTINNVKIIKNKKEDFIINKFKSNNFSIIRGINNKKTNLVINKIISNYSINNMISNYKNNINDNKNKEEKYLDNRKDNLEIERASEEFISKKRRKRKMKKAKKNKRYKFKFLFISDYNQLFIKKSKICDNNINEKKKSCIDYNK